MSLLTPLYVLGALAIAGPILFHLIRRRPQGEVRFSSLMFLKSTPPTLTRRSRLDQLLLLALRAAALGLLALAFARPFFRQAFELGFDQVERSQVAIVIDTSASMRRGDLWPRAKQLAAKVIEEAGPNDDIAIYSFDHRPQVHFSLAESAALEPGQRQSLAKSRINDLEPGWGSTVLGQALVEVAADLHENIASANKEVQSAKRIVLISDFQEGSNTNALNTFEWPSDVELDVKSIPFDSSNAGLHLLAKTLESGEDESSQALRVRVTNSRESKDEQFRLIWRDEDQREVGYPTSVSVPAGESRVIRIKKPETLSGAFSLVLDGDSQTFDNTLHFAAETPSSGSILYVGSEAANDVEGHLYYLARAFEASSGDQLELKASDPTDPIAFTNVRLTPLIVLVAPTTTSNHQLLSDYLTSGGTVLVVMASAELGATVSAITGDKADVVREGEVKTDVMLQEIDFKHPLFAPFAAAQYNDFTRVRFWRYRDWDVSQLPGFRVIARFEGGDPALVDKQIGKGRLYVLTSGWTPQDSQLARSSKFVPLLSGLVNQRDSVSKILGLEVMSPILLSREGSGRVTILKPNGDLRSLSSNEAPFTETDQPGIYRVNSDQREQLFAVNVHPAESRTDPLDIAEIEQLGCRLIGETDPAVVQEQLRQMRNAELEGRQNLWRWLIAFAIVVLICETWLASRRAQPRSLEVVA